MATERYRGRFAPSPTGPLHFGSLVTALASFLEARTRQGTWLLRIEDLDPLRESPEAADQILRCLEEHQLHWDEEIRYQSRRLDRYRAVAGELKFRGRVYACGCSRKELNANGGRHPFHCRNGGRPPAPRPLALRFALENENAHWLDRIIGAQQQTVVAEADDPVVIRKEGFVAYQLAVVVDDIEQGVTDIVRGSDLLETTAQQQQIHRALRNTSRTPGELPTWAHIPVVVNAQGQKLSKQNHAPALDDNQAGDNLWLALRALGQHPPAQLRGADPGELLGWAQEHWQLCAIPLSHSQQP